MNRNSVSAAVHSSTKSQGMLKDIRDRLLIGTEICVCVRVAGVGLLHTECWSAVAATATA